MSHNIAALPESQRKAIQRDKYAAKLAHDIKRGAITDLKARVAISRLGDPDRIEDMGQRLDKYLAVNVEHEQHNSRAVTRDGSRLPPPDRREQEANGLSEPRQPSDGEHAGVSRNQG